MQTSGTTLIQKAATIGQIGQTLMVTTMVLLTRHMLLPVM
jgi:hypothetical protein